MRVATRKHFEQKFTNGFTKSSKDFYQTIKTFQKINVDSEYYNKKIPTEDKFNIFGFSWGLTGIDIFNK